MKKHIIISGFLSLLLVVLILIVALFPFRELTKKTDYKEAKSTSVKLYEKREKEFHSARDALEKNLSADDIKIAGVEEIFMDNGTDNYTRIICFCIGTQGLTGGQYWGLYYTSNDKPADPFGLKEEFQNGPYAESYYYSKPDEHIFYATEKIEEYWYFYYMDYDGNRHGLDW